MSARTYWNLLVLFGVVCQGIIGTIAENNIGESSEHLVRQKRVINHQLGGDVREKIKNVPYIVQVKEYYTRQTCIGVILSTHIVLTLVKCVVGRRAHAYTVYSGNAQKTTHGVHIPRHSLKETIELMGNNTHRPEDGIALITVDPPFVFSINTRNIELYEGQIPPRSYATVSGWGCHAKEDPGTAHPTFLRSITVPIISNSDCATLHTDSFRILDSHICTFDSTGHQYCGDNDEGAPLVITVNNMKKLVGIHLWSGRGVRGWAYPDVFVNLQHPRYKAWIKQSIQRLNQNENILRNPRNH